MDWFIANWPGIIIPLAVFAAIWVVDFGLRRLAYDQLERWASKTNWKSDQKLIRATHTPSPLWYVIAGIHQGITISTLPEYPKVRAGRTTGSLLVVAIMLVAMNTTNHLLQFYNVNWKQLKATLFR